MLQACFRFCQYRFVLVLGHAAAADPVQTPQTDQRAHGDIHRAIRLRATAVAPRSRHPLWLLLTGRSARLREWLKRISGVIFTGSSNHRPQHQAESGF